MPLNGAELSTLSAAANGRMLYAFHSDLRDGDCIALYRPATADEAHSVAVTILRDGIRPFAAEAGSIRQADGKCYAEADSAPGNQSTYTYMLLRQVATFNRATGRIDQASSDDVVGMTAHDRFEVDLAPGLYYVSARNDSGGAALLLGPYAHHLQALTMVGRASSYLVARSPEAIWLHYGTARRDDAVEDAPQGKLNAVVLSDEEKAALVQPLDHLEHDEHERPSCRP